MTEAFFFCHHKTTFRQLVGLLPHRGWYSSTWLGLLEMWEIQLVVLYCVDNYFVWFVPYLQWSGKDYVSSLLVYTRWYEMYWLYCTVSMGYRPTIWLLKVKVMYQLALEKPYTVLKISKGDIKLKASKECFFIAMWSIILYLAD